MAESKHIFEIKTPQGPITLSIGVDTEGLGAVTQLNEGVVGYALSIAECHDVLDKLGVPSAKGVDCKEVGCESGLGHRTRTLRDRCLSAENTLEALRALPADQLPLTARQLLDGTLVKEH